MNRADSAFQRLIRTALAISPAFVAGLFLTACAPSGPMMPREPEYLVELDQANAIGYEIAWQSAMARARGAQTTGLYAYRDYVVATESGRNVISAVEASNGVPVWERQVGDHLEKLLGIERADVGLIAATQSRAYILDVANGSVKASQSLGVRNVAGTTPFVFGPYLVYGAVDGRLVYHHLGVGLEDRSYQLGAPIELEPVWSGDELVVITRAGYISLMDSGNLSRIWEKRVLDTVLAAPQANDRMVFVSGMDQSVWAFRRTDGKMMWRYRTEKPLMDDPRLLNDTLYQTVEGRGLVALDAQTGQARWTCPEVMGGTVIARTDGDLIIWDRDDSFEPRGSTFYRVDEQTGTLIGHTYCDGLIWADTDRFENANIYGLSRLGKLIKLVP